MLEQIRKRLHEYVDAAADPRDLWHICYQLQSNLFNLFGESERKQFEKLLALVKQLDDKEIAYLASPSRCPICGSDDITANAPDFVLGEVYQDVWCKQCDTEWEDRYTLASMEIKTDD